MTLQALTLAALGLAGAADVYEHRMRTDKVGVFQNCHHPACCDILADSPSDKPKQGGALYIAVNGVYMAVYMLL